MSKKNASVLILSLWSLLFLSILALLSSSVARQQIFLMGSLEDRIAVYDLARSGINLGIEAITSKNLYDSTVESDSLNDYWANNPSIFYNQQLRKGKFTLSQQYRSNINDKEQVWYGLVDEERKLNLNTAELSNIVNLFLQLTELTNEEAFVLAKAIIDWRDIDDYLHQEGQNQDNNNSVSEISDYRNSGYQYLPKNANFQSLEEILLVKGMTPAIFSEIFDYATIYTDGLININTASSIVLRAMGLSEDNVEKIIFFRTGPDGIEGTRDDYIFSKVANITEELSKHYDMTEEDKAQIKEMISKELLTVSSHNFQAKCNSSLDNGQLGGKIICVFDRKGFVKYWAYKS